MLLMTWYLFVFTATFPPLRSCCVCDKYAACDSVGGQSEEGGVDKTALGCWLQTQSSCQSVTCHHDPHRKANADHLCDPYLQINDRENVRGQPDEAQGEVWELHQTGNSSEFGSRLKSMLLYGGKVRCSVLFWMFHWLIHPVQETEWQWCRLTPGGRWSQWTGKVCLLTSFVKYWWIWPNHSLSVCLFKGPVYEAKLVCLLQSDSETRSKTNSGEAFLVRKLTLVCLSVSFRLYISIYLNLSFVL